ncbi:hypothetical protein BH23CYA1_BH23CYA1_21830 [soil metagenome]
MSQIPTDFAPDSTLALAFNGYQFISQGCQRHQSDVFQTRLLFEKTICLKGADAAHIFYDVEKFTRQGAAPKRAQKTLFGEGGDFYLNHRCPGEWITIALMMKTLEFLTCSITYEVPPQDLSVSLSQMPTVPESRFIISNVVKAISPV